MLAPESSSRGVLTLLAWADGSARLERGLGAGELRGVVLIFVCFPHKLAVGDVSCPVWQFRWLVWSVTSGRRVCVEL